MLEKGFYARFSLSPAQDKSGALFLPEIFVRTMWNIRIIR